MKTSPSVVHCILVTIFFVFYHGWHRSGLNQPDVYYDISSFDRNF